MYHFFRSLVFLLDAETAHYVVMNGLKLVCQVPLFKQWIHKAFCPPAGKGVSIWKLDFANKVGLAAGFDKNAKYLSELTELGFGFVEIGTVTPRPQEGNPRPRLFRLPADKALINRMGFNNEGVEVVKKRLVHWHTLPATQRRQLIIGGNIGKNKVTPNDEAWKDYEICFNELYDYVDYFVVNVSSPNTPGLRELQEKESLRKIITHLQTLRLQKLKHKPILLKIAPDLTHNQLDDVIDLSAEIKLDGLVATNTTISREELRTNNEQLTAIGAGGLSGLPVKNRSTEVVQYIHDKTNGSIPIIASGGIFTAADAKEKLQAGASLVQVWTGFIYEGPAIARKICEGL